jgi:hypothetical protein
MIYLLCQSEHDVSNKNFDKNRHTGDSKSNPRVMGAAAGISCAVYIHKVLIARMDEAKEVLKNEVDTSKDEVVSSSQAVLSSCEHLWVAFLSSPGGSLDSISHSNESQAAVDDVRNHIMRAVSAQRTSDQICRSLVMNGEFRTSLLRLETELIYEYSSNSHLKYRGHLFHEWMCEGANKAAHDSELEADKQMLYADSVPILPNGCISRMLRRIELPEGLSRHQPIRGNDVEAKVEEPADETGQFNADFAVIFGTSLDNKSPADPQPVSTGVERFGIVPLNTYAEKLGASQPSHVLIPPSMESYATAPVYTERPLLEAMDKHRLSHDGWEISMINFIVPTTSGSEAVASDDCLYGVSLVFRYETDDEAELNSTPIEVTKQEDGKSSPVVSCVGDGDDKSKIRLALDVEGPVFNQMISKSRWSTTAMHQESDDERGSITVGIALLSRRNVMPAMRETLARFYDELSTSVTAHTSRRLCLPLVDILGNFGYKGVETQVLSSLLGPFLKTASSRWLQRPLTDQKEKFESDSLEFLVETLSPIPLALLFVTALLEQKIVFSSSRRGILLSASMGLKCLLQPLGWSHLFVPLVPTDLASDLVQYPAPYILGIPSDDKGSMELLKSLPKDVTLVDLDIGRVILNRDFSQAFDEGSSSKASGLRTQVLYLAETLGSVFGAKQNESLWCCDSPVTSLANEKKSGSMMKAIAVRTACHDFIAELISGTLYLCCIWSIFTSLSSNLFSCV